MCESISKYILDKRFYISIIDKQGQQGAEGAQGSRGPIGAQGATGPIGLTGNPYGITADCFGAYLYWDTDTSDWVVGTQNITLGCDAGKNSQGSNSIAIGLNAGTNYQNTNSIAIGHESGRWNQGGTAIAIGYQAGFTGQGNYSIAIGNQAGYTGQSSNSIVLNATNSSLTAGTTGFFVAPIRDNSSNYVLFYQLGTNEITYSSKNLISNEEYGLFLYTDGTIPASPVPTYNAAGIPATIDYIYLKFPNYTSFGNNWIPTYSGATGADELTRLNIPLKGLYSISFFGCNQSTNNNFEFFISRNSNNSFDLNEISSAMNLLSAGSSRQTTVSVTTVLNAGDYINFGMFAPSTYTSFGRESAFINLIQRL
jgi:hypothetical protein